MTSAAKTPVQQSHRANKVRDGLTVGLLGLGLLLPWNLQSGITIGIAGMSLGLLIVVTLLSVAGVALTHVGPFSGEDADPTATNRIRLLLNVPYLLVAVGFVAVAVVRFFATGSSTEVPPGIGPGVWLGLGGAILAAQPVITSADSVAGRRRTVRTVAVASLVLGTAAVLFTLYQRTRFVLPGITDADTGTQNVVVAITALLYAVVALVPVIIVARWMFTGGLDGYLATVLLAVSALTAGAVVWILPVGREVDAFHGIAQSTSTAGIGYEGYIAWVVVGALIGTGTVMTVLRREAADTWRAATRKCLLLIAVWCGGTALLRVADLMTSAVLDLPSPPYNATALMAADLLIAVLALWLLVNSSGKGAPRGMLVGLLGVLSVATVCRLVLGVALVPRVRPLNPTDINDVYGNTLVQQITGTFDVALCVLALISLAIAVLSSRGATQRNPGTKGAVAQPVAPQSRWVPADASPPTIALRTGPSAPTIAMPAGQAAPRDQADDVLAESTQRFAAGTTYGVPPRTTADGPRGRGH